MLFLSSATKTVPTASPPSNPRRFTTWVLFIMPLEKTVNFLYFSLNWFDLFDDFFMTLFLLLVNVTVYKRRMYLIYLRNCTSKLTSCSVLFYVKSNQVCLVQVRDTACMHLSSRRVFFLFFTSLTIPHLLQ